MTTLASLRRALLASLVAVLGTAGCCAYEIKLTTAASLAAFTQGDLDYAVELTVNRAFFTLERLIRENRLVALRPGLSVDVIQESGQKSLVRVLESGHTLWVMSGTLESSYGTSGSAPSGPSPVSKRPPAERVEWQETETHRVKIKYRGSDEIGRWEFLKTKPQASPSKEPNRSVPRLLDRARMVASLAIRTGSADHLIGVHVLVSPVGRKKLERIEATLVGRRPPNLRIYQVDLSESTFGETPLQIEVLRRRSGPVIWKQVCETTRLPADWRISLDEDDVTSSECWERQP